MALDRSKIFLQAMTIASAFLNTSESRAMIEEETEIKTQSIAGKNRDIIREAIEDTCTFKGEDLYNRILQKIEPLQIFIDDIRSLAVSEEDAKNLEYPVTIYLPKQDAPLSPQRIKNALIAGLMYPVELQFPERDLLYVQKYNNVPEQLTLASLYGHPVAIENLESVMFFSDLNNIDPEHSFYKIISEYKNSINGKSFDTFSISRPKAPNLWTSQKSYVDLIADSATDFFDTLVGLNLNWRKEEKK